MLVNEVTHAIVTQSRRTEHGTFTFASGAAGASSCFVVYSFKAPAQKMNTYISKYGSPTFLAEEDYPSLARIWKNDSDAIFDTL
jgi:hypothetical protein